ncbi:50S ribosomal protein L16 [Erysipelotrichaceae bacterium Oil+RF-744-GAM-WT-6]|jgi:large subunit ribosomal protein L16|uniref:Large ribosomal subunit protein uL16 n=1 Tax=Stecheria intestinalis TaxID=2606630 RepID=A0A7X2TF93_9FIRM|nr:MULTISPECIES: 50S ribosomal protein L16 [Erysipelotrichaceae]MCI2153597.1 50S ribosomal protein L16 [Solobacterium sp.]MDY3232978.1 50S ribosomal protein L16 [Erysipelotrichaceae bacterium]MDY4681322.1 50S ribosomal protein L16 [Lachnospiraceae bacterium]MCI6745930.1 50S ribosomal protein L16 [Anaerolactibacter massiliensis]MDD5881574.1 50S ribosomal protein L16 [Stecheria intestinalis]
MLMPNRVKYRRPHRLSYEGKSKAGRDITFGEYGLVAMEGAYVSSNQLEAARVAMTRYMDRGGKVWIKVFPQLAKTKKPLEVRMGSGKGAPDHWVAVVQKGRVLFEIGGVDEATAREALRLGANKLGVKTRFAKKGEVK